MFEFSWQKRIERSRRRHYDTLLATCCILLDKQRHKCVNNLPMVVACPSQKQNQQPCDHGPTDYHCTTKTQICGTFASKTGTFGTFTPRNFHSLDFSLKGESDAELLLPLSTKCC